MLPQSEAARRRRCAARSCWSRATTRKSITYSFVDAAWEARFCRQRQSAAAAESDCQPDGRDALDPARRADRYLRFNLNRKQDRVRLFEIGRCFCRSGRRLEPAVNRSPACVTATPCPSNGARPRARRFLRRQGRSRGAVLARGCPISRPRSHPALHPGQAAQGVAGRARRRLDRRSCIRAGSRSTSCRPRRCCSNWIWPCCCAAAVAGVCRDVEVSGGAPRPRGGRGRRRQRAGASGRHAASACRTSSPSSRCSTSIAAKAWRKAKKALHSGCYCKILKKL